MIDVDKIINNAQEYLNSWDINKTIEEVRQSEEIKKLDQEIEYLKGIQSIFKK